MKIILLAIALALCTGIACNAAEDPIYKISLKDGREITGKLEETGLDKYKIHMIFKGRVMGTMDVTAADIKSKKLLPPPKVANKPKEDSGKKTEGEQETEKPPEQSTATKSSKELYDAYYTAYRENVAAQKELDGALVNLKVRAESTTLKDGISKNLKLCEDRLKTALKTYDTLSTLHLQQAANGGSKGIDDLRKHYQLGREHLQMLAEAEIIKSKSARARSDFILSWFSSADLKDANVSREKDPKKAKQLERLNNKLKELRAMRDDKKIDYKKVLQFYDHTEFFTLYGDTRK